MFWLVSDDFPASYRADQFASAEASHPSPTPRGSRNTYHRVICVVPYVGLASALDPKRPLRLPAPAAAAIAGQHTLPSLLDPTSRSGIIAFKHLPSDDKSVALVEYVAVNRAALLPILNDKTIVSFEKGRHTRVEIETALKKYKKDFVLEQLGVAAR